MNQPPWMGSKERRATWIGSSFVATISAAVTGCSSGETLIEEPSGETIGPYTSEAPSAVEASNATEPTSEESVELTAFSIVVNAKDDQNRTIFSSGDGTCYIHLPFPAQAPGEELQPGTTPPSVPTQCPPSMNDAAWRDCAGGTIHTNELGDTCVCFVMGNPPHPPRRTACPTN